MTFLPTLLKDATPFLHWPGNLIGWLGWFLLWGILIALGGIWRRYQKIWELQEWGIFSALLGVTFVTTLFFSVRLSSVGAISMLGSLTLPPWPIWMVFAAVPWVLAAGLLGPYAASGLAALSGLLLALVDTHSPFTPLEYALIGLLMGAAVNQPHRSRFFQVARHPLFVGVGLTLLYPILIVVNSILAAGGTLPVLKDFVLTHVGGVTLVVAGSLLVAGLLGEVVVFRFPSRWGLQDFQQPSPAEMSLEKRSFYIMGPTVVLVILALTILGWSISANAVQNLIRDRMESVAQLAAETVPFVLEVGQKLILQLAADSRLAQLPADEILDVLSQQLETSPYFRQLIVISANGKMLAEVPKIVSPETAFTREEQIGIELARQGVVFQYFVVPQMADSNAAGLSFIAPIDASMPQSILGQGEQTGRVLVGRSDLASNPFTVPILNSLDSLQEVGGEGILLDENGIIIYHPNRDLVMTPFTGEIEDKSLFYDETGSDGTRSLIYYQPAVGRPWAVVVIVSAQEIQRLALNIAAPLLGLLLVLSVILVALLRVVLRVVTSSLRDLAVEEGLIAEAQSELGMPLLVSGVYEAGQMRRAFEQMRASLKARLDEQGQLLLVSREVASNLEMERAVKPILAAALTRGASSACVVLLEAAVPEFETGIPTRFGLGHSHHRFKTLDDQILALNQKQSQVVLTNPARTRSLKFESKRQVPGALLALALHHENLYYGSLWVAYDRPHKFLEDEIRFLTTLAGQASLAAANATLYLSAEIGRQQLAAILASTPDPVLVTDRRNRLLLANPVAWQVFGSGSETGQGLPIEQVISQKEIVDLLRSSSDDHQRKEINLPNRGVYAARATSVLADGKRVGRVCVLRDITHLKNLDEMKTEFLDIISHDLRNPLRLIQEYANMLEMFGDLSEQQVEYVNKIVAGSDAMSRLVTNLLDMERIEAGVGLKLQVVPIIDVIDEVVKALDVQAAQKSIALTTFYPQETRPLVKADQALIKQAIYNLVENAIKYTESDGKVEVAIIVRSQQGRVRIAVHDTGIGIAPVDQERIFEKYFRVDEQDTRTQRGSGLGLAIVKKIVERHGGRIWVKSQLGEGSTFCLEIPVKKIVE